jgi:hypothetical protein
LYKYTEILNLKYIEGPFSAYRSSRRAIKPFVSLPRHRRHNAVIKLQGRMLRNISTTGSAMFDSYQLLMDPNEPQRVHE